MIRSGCWLRSGVSLQRESTESHEGVREHGWIRSGISLQRESTESHEGVREHGGYGVVYPSKGKALKVMKESVSMVDTEWCIPPKGKH